MSKDYLKLLITEAVRQSLLEQDPMMGGGAAPAPGAPPAPPAGGGMGGGMDMPPPGATSAPPPAEAGPEGIDNELESQPGGITIDSLIERLNIIRAGKSLTEPEVYGKMRSLINGMTQEQKTMLNFILQEIEKVVAKVNPLQPGAPGAPGGGGGAPPGTPPAPPPEQPPAPPPGM